MRFPATVIDLSTLPQPQIIDALTFESILAASKADAIARAAAAGLVLDTLDLESELITIVLEACAYREMLLRAEINDDALALLLAFATGPDLEQIGARFGVRRNPAAFVTNPRLPVAAYPQDWETDDQLRKRIQLAPDAYSNAGTLRGYQYHVLTAGGPQGVTDCNIISSSPGRIDIILLAASGQPADAAMQAVYQRVTQTDVKPLTDDVRVMKAQILPYTITAKLRIPSGPDPAAVRAAALASVQAYAKQQYKVGAKVYLTGILGALQVPNVFEVVLTSPTTNLDPGSYGAALASFNITTEVVDG